MIPYLPWVLCTVGTFRVEYFHVLVVIAVVCGCAIAVHRGARRGIDPKDLRFVSIGVVIGGFVGAHATSALVYHPARTLADPWLLCRLWEGLSSVGGILGGGLTFAWLVRRSGLAPLPLADTLALGLAPAWIIGRVGCFAAHDHPGARTAFFLAVLYPDGARHDLGLYEALATAAISAGLYGRARRKRGDGSIVGFLAMTYAPVRFLIDCLGRPDPRCLGLTLAQWACLVCFALGLRLVRRASSTQQTGGLYEANLWTLEQGRTGALVDD